MLAAAISKNLHLNKDFAPPDFTVITEKHRAERRGGGIMLYIETKKKICRPGPREHFNSRLIFLKNPDT